MFEYENDDYMNAINDCSYYLSSEYQLLPEPPGYSKFPDFYNQHVYPLIEPDLNLATLTPTNVQEYSSQSLYPNPPPNPDPIQRE